MYYSRPSFVTIEPAALQEAADAALVLVVLLIVSIAHFLAVNVDRDHGTDLGRMNHGPPCLWRLRVWDDAFACHKLRIARPQLVHLFTQ